MDNPTTLLVAIMFVTILAMAIGNILTTCAEIAGGLRHPMPERIQLSWIFLMLFALLGYGRANGAALCNERHHRTREG